MIEILSDAVNSGMTGNLHVAIACLGATLGIGFIGAKGAEAVGRNPGAFTSIMIYGILAMAMAEAIVFYAIFLAN